MTLRAILRLARIPNVFTAFANVVAGVYLARAGRFEARDGLLVAASGALYLGGMVLNDLFDRRIDAVERPERPIPSGAVTPAAAAILGFGLLALGIMLAGLFGVRTLAVAVALTAAILLYDGRVKGTGWGPLAMGTCRLLNVVLGLCAASPGAWSSVAVTAALVMGAYTAIITYLARDEVGGSSRMRAQSSIAMMSLLAAVAGVALIEKMWGQWMRFVLTAPFAAAVLVQGRRLFAPLWTESSGGAIGRAIGGGILLMPAIDATMVAAAGWAWPAVVVFACAAPAYVLRRWYYLT
jgi:4-hydroxybenzoate polyprenyltransferase